MILTGTLPLFALICLGYALYRAGLPDRAFWPAAERLNYVVLFPALLVANLADAPLDDPAIAAMGGAIVTVILLAAMALSLARRLRPTPAARYGPVVQGTIRFNTYLGLAITGSLLGPPGLERAAVLLAIAVPLVNVLSVIALTERQGSAWTLLRPLATNPLILGCAVGIALALLGTGLPHGAERFLGFLAQASLPLGLLCVGAALRPGSVGGDVVALGTVSALRLLAMPALAAVIALAFGLGATERTILIVFTAIPTAPTAYVLTQQLRGDGRLMAGLVTGQTMLAVATIPLMLAFLGAP